MLHRVTRRGTEYIQDGYGALMARLSRCGKYWILDRYPACSLGTYLRILSSLQEQGYDVR